MSERLYGRKVNVTKDYRLFDRSPENRILCVKKHKKLERSMREYGFLPCYPIICYRDEQKRLIVKDGQHRVAIAETLGLPVYWIEETVDFDVAVVNSTAKIWTTKDYAEKWAERGLKPYIEGIAFSNKHGISIGMSFAILGGTTTFGNVMEDFQNGTFKIKDRPWADAIASVYGPITAIAPATKNTVFLLACMAICRVKELDVKRLLESASRCREKLVSYGKRDAYLDMFEEIYNFHRKYLFGLKSAAIMAMRERVPTHKAAKAKRDDREAAAPPKDDVA